MAEINVAAFEDTFVIHFGGEFQTINAYTLAGALVSLADAAKAANAVINPGYEVEVVVEALGSGSFKARIRTIYKGAANLFSRQRLEAIVLSVIATFVYEQTLGRDSDVVVNVQTEEVVIEHEGTRIVIPRHVHEAVTRVERDSAFRKAVSDTIRAVDEDPNVESLGFQKEMEDPVPPIRIPRDRFVFLPANLEQMESETREVIEIADLIIMRAILERSKRRWEFVWNGVRISAPVTHNTFYDDFFAHRITVAPGDALKARLKIRQRRDPHAGIFINESYEVVEVMSHVPKARQQALSFTDTQDDRAE